MINFSELDKEIDKENEENYRKYGIRSLGFRTLIIRWILSFADEEYQKKAWCGKGPYLYSARTEKAYNFIIEDSGMEVYLEKQEIPYEKIGWIFKSKEEAEELYKFCQIFNEFLEDVPQRSPNDYYLNSKFYSPMVKAAQSTIKVFFKNEEEKPEAYSKM